MSRSKSRQRRQPIPQRFVNSSRYGDIHPDRTKTSGEDEEQRHLDEVSKHVTMKLNRAIAKAREEATIKD